MHVRSRIRRAFAAFVFAVPSRVGGNKLAAVVPEPQTNALVALGIMSIVWLRLCASRRIRGARAA